MYLLSPMMLVLLSAGTSLAAVNMDWLTNIVRGIRTQYRIDRQFCVAANIPLNLPPQDLANVLRNDGNTEDVEDELTYSKVYQGRSVTIAKPVRHEHAEYIVLKNLGQLSSNSEGHFLLIYSYLSPCAGQCANPDDWHNILQYIVANVIPYWTNYAFVFTTVYDNPNDGSTISRQDLTKAVKELGKSGLGLRNIFRCYQPGRLPFQCHSCSSQGRVSDVCVDNNFVPQQGRSRSSSRSTIRSSSSGSRSRDTSMSTDRSRSTSRSRDRSMSTDRGRSTSRSRDRSTSRERSRSTSRSRDRSMTRDRSTSRDRSRSTSRSSSGSSRNRDRGRKRQRNTSRERSPIG
ncbi:uncharacterized protein LOC127360266 [Dicentrarchus labrax]|uniref:uncharacterized protein LOC127360266 n=1 Tax=Dicentrarchus labrax TaxID=13489 RepID=UPI0021F58A39|nr:uncharacterized protein LOC127360266 [Dicentrarchus labrax]